MLERTHLRRWLTVLILTLPLTFSCARAPLKSADEVFRKVPAPILSDDLPLNPLLDAISSQVDFLRNSPNSSEFVFDGARFTRQEYLDSLARLVALGRATQDTQAFFKIIESEFDFYEVYGRDEWGEVFITSYYEPLIPGSLKPTARFSQPLYRKPDDLISLDLGAFDSRFAEHRKLRGRIRDNALVPYFSRQEIDTRQSLRGRKLEICWVDPVDSFFLQVQGSGTIDLGNGRTLRVNYAEKNGHSYQSLSQFLKGKIPSKDMNLHTIEAFLRSLPRKDMQHYLNLNPSYVFFRESEESALTAMGVPATNGRTIATDPRYFPKGALAFLIFEKPVFSEASRLIPTAYEPSARFVLDQDIGGAILGPGRLDLFWGRGAEAKLHAGAMKNPGRLYYLAPKKSQSASP
ncbi:MAG: hypothetical protein A2X94_11225 [Bdellovibrionales bacterium GWB1_55_8]|nr:MAG: hypothetical protein A2X94_11225 [Bdellovibrionales bacterium GWB1_55_8]